MSASQVYGFAAGRFFCRVLPGHTHEEALYEYIDDPLWEDDKGALMDFEFKLTDRLEATVAATFGDTNRRGSWLLARLWLLTNGMVRTLLGNVDESGIGMGDGGYLLFWLLIAQEGHGVACLGFELQSDVWDDRSFSQSLLTSLPLRSAGFDLDALAAALAETLCAQPCDLAICRVDVQNPEENCFPYAYGWDGERLLGDDDPALRELLARWSSPDPNIRIASLEALMQVRPPNIYDLLWLRRDDPSPEVRKTIDAHLDTLGMRQ